MVAYATRQDLYRYGLPRGLLANPGRLVASVDTSTETFVLDGHGFEDDDELLFRAEEGGTLPAPLVAGTTYYAIRVSYDSFRVAASSGGSAINITAAGSSTVVSTSLEPTIDAELERFSRLVDSYIPAHAVPLESPYPAVVVSIVAKLAAESLLAITGQASASITASAEQTRKELARLMAGVPLRDAAIVTQANLARAEGVTSAWASASGAGFIP